jgi:protein dithiol oxidoreductase (disulfide-forming)
MYRSPKLIALLIALCFAPVTLSQAAFVAGKDFTILSPPQATESPGKIEVVEFFSYGCPVCAELEPHLHGWVKKLPPDVVLKRIPVAFHKTWIPLAKAHHVIEILGRSDLVEKIFIAYHVEKIALTDEKVLFDWLLSKGVDATKLNEAWNSFTLNARLSRDKSMAVAYGVDGVPTLYVDGKFRVKSTRATTPGFVKHSQVAAALDFLVNKARAERK